MIYDAFEDAATGCSTIFSSDRNVTIVNFGFTTVERTRFLAACDGRKTLSRDEFRDCWIEARGFPPSVEALERLFPALSPSIDIEKFSQFCVLNPCSLDAAKPFLLAISEMSHQYLSNIWSLLRFIPFLILFVAVVLSEKGLGQGYFIHKEATDQLISSEFNAACGGRSGDRKTCVITFEEIGDPSQLYSWMSNVLIPSFWVSSVDGPASGPLKHHSYAMGALKMENVRVDGIRNDELLEYYFAKRQQLAVGSVAADEEENKTTSAESYRHPFPSNPGEIWLQYPPMTPETPRSSRNYFQRNGDGSISSIVRNAFEKRDCQAELIDSYTIGEVGEYRCGGFEAIIPFSIPRSQALKTVEDLSKHQWIDRSTRAIFVHFFVFNKDTQLVHKEQLGAEVSSGGKWIPLRRQNTFKLFSFSSKSGGYIALLVLFWLSLCLQIVFFIWDLCEAVIRQTRHLGAYGETSAQMDMERQTEPIGSRSSFSPSKVWFGGKPRIAFASLSRVFSGNKWLWLEMMNYGLLIVIWAYRFGSWSRTKNIRPLYEQYVYDNELENYSYEVSVAEKLEAVSIMLCVAQLFRYLKLFRTFDCIIRTVTSSTTELIGLGITFFLTLSAFSIAGFVAYSGSIIEFSSIPQSMQTLLLFLVGDFDYETWDAARAVLSPIYFALLFVLLLVILFNSVIGVLGDNFSDVVGNEFDAARLLGIISCDPNCKLTFHSSFFESLTQEILFRCRNVWFLLKRSCRKVYASCNVKRRKSNRSKNEPTSVEASHAPPQKLEEEDDDDNERMIQERLSPIEYWEYLRGQLFYVYYGNEKEFRRACRELLHQVDQDQLAETEFLIKGLGTQESGVSPSRSKHRGQRSGSSCGDNPSSRAQSPTSAAARSLEMESDHKITLWEELRAEVGDKAEACVVLAVHLPHYASNVSRASLLLRVFENYFLWRRSISNADLDNEDLRRDVYSRLDLLNPPQQSAAHQKKEFPSGAHLQQYKEQQESPQAQLMQTSFDVSVTALALFGNVPYNWQGPVHYDDADPRTWSRLKDHWVDVEEQCEDPVQGRVLWNAVQQTAKRLIRGGVTLDMMHRQAAEVGVQRCCRENPTHSDSSLVGVIFTRLYEKELGLMDFLWHAVLLALFIYAVVLTYGTGDAFAVSASVHSTLAETPFSTDDSEELISFSDIRTFDEVHAWLRDIPSQYFSVNGSIPSIPDIVNIPVGALRLRQQRVGARSDCGYSSDALSDYPGDPQYWFRSHKYFSPTCIPPFASASLLRGAFEPLEPVSNEVQAAFLHSGDNSPPRFLTGELAVYAIEKGYTIDIPLSTNRTRYKEIIAELEVSQWLDLQSKILIVDGVFFNVNNDVFLHAELVIEFSSGGMFVPSTRSMTYQLKRSENGHRGLVVFFIFLVAHILVYIARTIDTLLNTSSSWTQLPLWWWYDLFMYLILLVSGGLKLNLLMHTAHDRAPVDLLNFESYPESLIYVSDRMYAMMALDCVVAIFITMKVYKMLSLNNDWNTLSKALLQCIPSVSAVLLIAFVVLTGLAAAGHVVFGKKSKSMVTMQAAYETIVIASVPGEGGDALDEWYAASPTYAGVYYSLIVILLLILMANMMTSVVANAYTRAKDQSYSSASIRAAAALLPKVKDNNSGFFLFVWIRYFFEEVVYWVKTVAYKCSRASRDRKLQLLLSHRRSFYRKVSHLVNRVELGPLDLEAQLKASELLHLKRLRDANTSDASRKKRKDLQLRKTDSSVGEGEGNLAPSDSCSVEVRSGTDDGERKSRERIHIFGVDCLSVKAIARTDMPEELFDSVSDWCVEFPNTHLNDDMTDTYISVLNIVLAWTEEARSYCSISEGDSDALFCKRLRAYVDRE